MDRMWTLFGNTCNLDHTLKKRSRSSITEICLGGRFRSFFLYRYVSVCVCVCVLLWLFYIGLRVEIGREFLVLIFITFDRSVACALEYAYFFRLDVKTFSISPIRFPPPLPIASTNTSSSSSLAPSRIILMKIKSNALNKLSYAWIPAALSTAASGATSTFFSLGQPQNRLSLPTALSSLGNLSSLSLTIPTNCLNCLGLFTGGTSCGPGWSGRERCG